MTKEFFENIMRIPSVSQNESMVQEFLMDWAKANGYRAKKDGKGNIYMQKGSGKYFPCLANHMDTVHHDQKELVEQKIYKEIKWEGNTVKAFNPITKQQTGLGMDDMGGCAIALAVLKRLPKAKAIFVVEEEIGMQGSRACDKHFFDDCAFIFSNDSPDRNRATHYSNGVQLYSDEFFEKYLKPICEKHGVTTFNSEPYTDIIQYRQHTIDGKHIECLNFGNGGYNPHSPTEYADFNDVCKAEELLYALCTEIPSDVQHLSDIKEMPRPKMPDWAQYYRPYSGRYTQGQFSFGGSEKEQEEYGYMQEDECEFTWTFKSSKNTEKFARSVIVEIGSDVKMKMESDVAVNVSGKFQDVKEAWRLAFNADNDSDFDSFKQLMKTISNAKRMLNLSIKITKKVPRPKKTEKTQDRISKWEHSDTDIATIALPEIEDKKKSMIFEDAMNVELQVDLDFEDGLYIINDTLGMLKEVYVAYINAVKETHYADWKEFSKKEFTTEFWKLVTFEDDVEEIEDEIEDEIEVDTEEIEDADFSMTNFEDWLANH